MYGLDNPVTREYGTRCLIARRLVERGVRFVQLFLSGQPWDTHSKNAETLKSLCARTDQPSAALVRDLKQRGLLDETIVLWTGEFGRLPVSKEPTAATTTAMASRSGSPAEASARATSTAQPMISAIGRSRTSSPSTTSRPRCFHALGLDHRKLTYPHEGRVDSLTDPEVTKAKIVPVAVELNRPVVSAKHREMAWAIASRSALRSTSFPSGPMRT